MQFSDDCRSHALVLMEIANESPKFREQALALAETWLTLANVHKTGSVLTRLTQDHSAAMTQNIDGVCLRLRGRRQVAREEHARMISLSSSIRRREAENAVLRHQLIVLQRRVRGRVHLTNGDRLFLVQLYRWFPSVLKAITIVRPETLVRWHRSGFRRYWRWKSGSGPV